MALILNIETSTKTCSASLAKDGKILKTLEETSDQYIHSERLNVFIEQLFADTNLSINDLNAICVSKGPGSFTGLRIGVASAKGLCYALNIPLITINSLTILAKYFSQKNNIGEEGLLIPMIDARRMEVYSSIFDNSLNFVEPIAANIIDENSFLERNEQLHLFGDGAEKCGEVLNRKNITIHPNFNTSASAMTELSYAKFQQQEFEDLAYFDPFYLKDFVAGVKKQS